MRKSDTARPRPIDLMVATALLTRLPLPRLPDRAFARQARAVWAFPLVGALVAVFASAFGYIALSAGLPVTVASGIVLTAQIAVTGAMHEDGLADTVDGFWGGWTRDRRLEIMRDSAIGTYGVLALILSLGLRWAALTALLPNGFYPVFAAAILSRAVVPVVMAALPHARSDGLSHSVGTATRGNAMLAALLGLGLAGVALGPLIVPVGLCLGLVVGALAWLAHIRIGGQTGDVLGTAQQVGELSVLLMALALMPT